MVGLTLEQLLERWRSLSDLPRAILYGLLFITAVYLLINVAYYMTMPMDQIAGNGNVPNDVAQKLLDLMENYFYRYHDKCYGTMNGFTMTAMRVPYAMAAKDQCHLKSLDETK